MHVKGLKIDSMADKRQAICIICIWHGLLYKYMLYIIINGKNEFAIMCYRKVTAKSMFLQSLVPQGI